MTINVDSYRKVTRGEARRMANEERAIARASMAETIIHNVGALCDEVERLRAVIARIDEAAGRADSTCDEPGITLSEAVRRELKDKRHKLFREPTP